MAKILVVEDDFRIRDLLRRDLSLVGHQVTEADSLQAARRALMEEDFDLLLLDIMLGKDSGFSLLSELTELPVICLTARGALEDKLKGLRMGADDYIVKPFSVLELLERIRAVLRRSKKAAAERFCLGDVEVDFAARQVFRKGQPVELSPQEFSLLECLVINRNLALSREKLLELAWGVERYFGDARTVDVHISKLRQKLGWEARIKTVYKLGYRLETRP